METVANRMTRTVLTLKEQDSLREAVDLVQRNHIRHIPVLSGPTVVGIVTDRDIKRATPSLLSGVTKQEYDRVLDGVTISQVMTRDPFTVTPGTPLADAVKVLVDRKYGALPVVEGGRLVGILTSTDCLRALHQMLGE